MPPDAQFDAGTVVVTPDGRGVVAAVLTDDFEFPQDVDGLVDVDASPDDAAYVVGLEAGGSAVYRASSLKRTSFDVEGLPNVSGEAVAGVVEEGVDGLDDLPEGWDRESVLEYWSSIGGSWEACVGDLTDDFDRERAEGFCSAMKDEVLGTERWRTRF